MQVEFDSIKKFLHYKKSKLNDNIELSRANNASAVIYSKRHSRGNSEFLKKMPQQSFSNSPDVRETNKSSIDSQILPQIINRAHDSHQYFPSPHGTSSVTNINSNSKYYSNALIDRSGPFLVGQKSHRHGSVAYMGAAAKGGKSQRKMLDR